MKTMTCRQMGGPCDAAMQGTTAEEMMQEGTKHLEEMAAQGDEGHKQAAAMMAEAAHNPEMAKQWEDKFKSDFAALPEE